MTVARITALSVEVLRQSDSATARVTTNTVEVLRQSDSATARVTALSVEVLRTQVTPIDVDHGMPVEYGGKASTDNALPVEWTSNIDATRQIPYEWQQGIGSDHQIPVEWKGAVVVDSDHDILIEWSSLLNIDLAIPFEWLQGIVSPPPCITENDVATGSGGQSGASWFGASFYIGQSGSFEIDAGRRFENMGLTQDQPVHRATLRLYATSAGGWLLIDINAESAINPTVFSGTHLPSSVTKTTATVTYESRGGVTGWHEIDVTAIIRELVSLGDIDNINIALYDRERAGHIYCPWPTNELVVCEFPDTLVEWQQGLALDHAIPVEWTVTINADREITYSWLQGIGSDHLIPYDWKGPVPIPTDHYMPIEWFTEMAIDMSIPVEWLQGLEADRDTPIEWRQGLEADRDIPVEWYGEVRPDFLIPIGWAGPTHSDQILFPEWDQELEVDNDVPAEWISGVERVHDMPIEWLLENVMISLQGMPISWQGHLESDHRVPYDWTLRLLIDEAIPVGWQLILLVDADMDMPIEWLSRVLNEDTVLVEWHLQMLIDHQIPYNWNSELLVSDAEIPFEWLEGLLSSVKLCNPSVLDDPDGGGSWANQFNGWFPNVDSVGFETTPLWVGRGFNTSPLLPSDEIASATLRLWVNQAGGTVKLLIQAEDDDTPTPWGYGHTTKLATYVAASVIYESSSSGINEFREIDITELVKEVHALGSLGYINISLRNQTSVGNYLYAPQGLSEIVVCLNKVPTLPVGWTEKLRLDNLMPVDWRAQLDVLQPIPIDWVRKIESINEGMPYEWMEQINTDSPMPFEWLLEAGMVSDHAILIEYQQIYLKKFDFSIPWEARGIFDKAYYSPVEWRGDPGSLHRLFYEWTDPLFALFVVQDKCEFWVASCENTDWASAKVGSSWRAEDIDVQEYADQTPQVWTAKDEEIGGVWCAAAADTAWCVKENPTEWIADVDNIWIADASCVDWSAQTQETVWNASSQGTRWTVFEPNPRG